MRWVMAVAFCLMLGIQPKAVHAQTVPIGQRIQIFTQIVEALGAAGDAIAKLANGIAVAAQQGTAGVDAVLTRLENRDMRKLLARTSVLAGEQRILVIDALETYVDDRRAGRPGDWRKTQQNITGVLETVSGLLPDVKNINSDFVNEEAYEQLVRVLSGRRSILMELASLPEPQTDEELALVAQAADKYRALHAELRKLNRAIAEYNRRRTGSPGGN